MADDGLPPAVSALLEKVNGKRRKLLLTRDDVAEAIQEALSSAQGIAVRHGGAELLAKTSLCLAVRSPKRKGVVVGLALVFADRPTPGRAWKDLQPWQQDFAKNLDKAHAWAATQAPDRVFVGAAKMKAAQPAKAASPKDGAKLLAQILANPADDQARLVYADWLTEHGDPRGELITVQLALAAARSSADKRKLAARERELLEKHARQWAKRAMQDAKEYELRRGFVALVKMTGAVWSSKGARLFEHDPIEELLISKPNAAGLKAIAAAAHTAKLRRIASSSPFWMQTAKDVQALNAFFASKHVGAVREIALHIDHDPYLAPVPDLSTLFEGAKLPGTQKLELSFGSTLKAARALISRIEAPLAG